MKFGWLKKAGIKFYARTHSDGVEMKGGGTLTAKIAEIVKKLREHHHQASEVNDLEQAVKGFAGGVSAPISHAVSGTTYGVASGSNYGHIRAAGNAGASYLYAFPFSTQYNTEQTSLNIANLCYNGVFAVRFKGSATGAPVGLESGTTYYGTIFTMNYQQTSGVSTTYGVTQVLSIPKAGKLYVRFVTSTSASGYGDWIDMTAIASGWS